MEVFQASSLTMNHGYNLSIYRKKNGYCQPFYILVAILTYVSP
uniref:Uncharacterized protein n=1 Tax=Setaria italica TaxID=4555 RepID=K3Y471_SETIT